MDRMRLSQNEIGSTFKWFGLTFKITFFDFYVTALGEWGPDEYHFVEKNHWCNGYMPGTGELIMEEGSAECEETFWTIPFLERLLGPYLAADICAKMAESDKWQSRFCEQILDIVEGDGLENWEWSD